MGKDKNQEKLRRQEEFLLEMKQKEQEKKNAFKNKLETEQKTVEEKTIKKKIIKDDAFNKKEETSKLKRIAKPANKDFEDASIQSDLMNLAQVKKETEMFMSKHSVKKSSSSRENEVIKQQNSSQEVQSCSQSETQSIKKDWPSPIVTVKANSFIPKINRQSEVEILKIGGPS